MQGFITSLAHQPRFTLFLHSVVAVDALTLLVSRSGHYTPTDHRFSSAVFVSAPPLLQRLALRVTQKHLRHFESRAAIITINSIGMMTCIYA